MTRRVIASFVALACLTACGGGGGKGSLPPAASAPQTKEIGTATFSLKLPGKNTMTKVRRPYYQSQATQGVGIDWTSSNPASPDYAAAISATCPGTLPAGVTSCSIDANGDTDYSFQLQIPGGTYDNFTVTTFDTGPVDCTQTGSCTFTGNELAQGQVAAPVVITAGASNTIPSLTFYGIPATVSFVAGPAQSHVVTYGGNLAVIGDMPQSFFVQAEDADGFLISSSDTGAPTITVTESAGDSPQHFTVASVSSNEYTLTAVDGSANATIDATATPGGTGLAAVTNAVTVTPVQELWTSQELGNLPDGIFGYPLYGGSSPGGAVDIYDDPIPNPLCNAVSTNCSFYNAAIDPSSKTIYATFINGSDDIPGVYAFTQESGTQGLVPQSSAAYNGAAGDDYDSMAIDSQHHGFLIDTDSGVVSLEAYSTASNGWSQITTSSAEALGTATSVAVAPTASNVPSALVGTVWVGLSGGGLLVYPAFSGTLTSTPATVSAGPTYAVGFDSAGDLWITDENDVYIYRVSGTATAPSISELGSASLADSPYIGASFGAAANQEMWFGEGVGLGEGFDFYQATCSSTCTIASSRGVLQPNVGSWAAFVTP